MMRKIFDSHIHWRDHEHNVYETLSDTKLDAASETGDITPQSYLPKHYFADSKDYDVAGFVHIEAEWDKRNPAGETQWLESIVVQGHTSKLPLGIVGFADLTRSNVEQILEAHASSDYICGIRQMLNYLPGHPELCWAESEHIHNPVWRSNYALLGKYDLDFDLMCFAHQMLAMSELIKQTPYTRVHLEHAGMPWDHSPQGRAQWRKGLRTLAQLPNTDIKISGLGNTIKDWNIDKIRPYVLEAIDIFGCNRVSFASNFPTDKLFSDYTSLWDAFSEIIADFSDSEQDAMFYSNAFRMYRDIQKVR